MTYNPLEPFIRDKIRRLARDYSGDPELEYFPDSTYDKVIGEHANWKRAAVEMVLSVAGAIEDDPTSIGSDGDSLSWSSLTKSLYETARRLTGEADDEDASVTVPSAVPYMPLIAPVEWRS